MSDRVRIEVSDGVADVRLDRPDKHNALDAAMFLGIVEAAAALAADSAVRAVVLSGEGASFCSGLDFPSFLSGEAGVDLLGGRDETTIVNLAQQAAYVWYDLDRPVIAAITGHCYGGGIQMAAACDVRIAAPGALLSVMEIRWGLVPDMTGTQLLPRLVRPDVLKELTWTGRKVTGTEAAEIGLVTRVDEDPHAAALSLAADIASRNPAAVRGAKRLIDAAADSDLAAGFALEEQVQRAILGSPNQLEAVRANFEKRPATFADD